MSHRFSFGNMDESEPETDSKVEETRPIHASNRGATITPLLRKKRFWQRWIDQFKRMFRKHEAVHFETRL